MADWLRKQGHTFNTNGGSGSASDTNFVGTRQEWEALSTAEQNQYDTVDIVEEDGAGGGRSLIVTSTPNTSLASQVAELVSAYNALPTLKKAFAYILKDNGQVYRCNNYSLKLFTSTEIYNDGSAHYIYEALIDIANTVCGSWEYNGTRWAYTDMSSIVYSGTLSLYA